MKYSYVGQANAVHIMMELETSMSGTQSGLSLQSALMEAKTTLRAAALLEKKTLVMDDLIKVAQEFVADGPSMNLSEIVQYQMDFKKLLDKLK